MTQSSEWCSHKGCCGEHEYIHVAEKVELYLPDGSRKVHKKCPVFFTDDYVSVIEKEKVYVYPVRTLIRIEYVGDQAEYYIKLFKAMSDKMYKEEKAVIESIGFKTDSPEVG